MSQNKISGATRKLCELDETEENEEIEPPKKKQRVNSLYICCVFSFGVTAAMSLFIEDVSTSSASSASSAPSSSVTTSKSIENIS